MTSPQTPADRPNILVLCMDQWQTHMRVPPEVRFPTMERLESEGVSFAPKITVDDARVDWAEPAVAVDRRIRACTPHPGAWI